MKVSYAFWFSALTTILCLTNPFTGTAYSSVAGVLDSNAAPQTGSSKASELENLAGSLTDGKATISHVTGEVRLLRSDSDVWVTANDKDSIEEGDQIKTGSGASVDVVYDESAFNIVHLEENTLAEFRGIEPTSLYLADGSIFNTLEGLPQGQTYEVATETAVNAIRGTEFLRTFNAADKTDNTVVGKGTVESFSIMPDGSRSTESIMIEKDKALTLNPQILQSTPFGQIQPERASKEHRQMIKNFSEGIEANLKESHGGVQALQEIRDNAKTLMSRPDFQETFQKKGEQMHQMRVEQRLAREGGPGKQPDGRNMNGDSQIGSQNSTAENAMPGSNSPQDWQPESMRQTGASEYGSLDQDMGGPGQLGQITGEDGSYGPNNPQGWRPPSMGETGQVSQGGMPMSGQPQISVASGQTGPITQQPQQSAAPQENRGGGQPPRR